ncbi:hypothetical protein GCM10023189_45300 [Nibrella saemangeumensis]|uniref:ACT domain-containing protein n=1 Tax=Nibrella saemangeumensis TaxID=1084526 RepID=A0ABP8NFN9_9BACT
MDTHIVRGNVGMVTVAVRGLTNAGLIHHVRRELGDAGIEVIGICPGHITVSQRTLVADLEEVLDA